MALAYIKFLGSNEKGAEFKADLGTNLYYRYKIGDSKRVVNGLELVDEVVHTSPIFQNTEGNVFNSAFEFKIPATLFNTKHRYLQLFSYKDQNGKSPAVSRVVSVYPSVGLLSDELPVSASVSQFFSMSGIKTQPKFNKCRSVGFSFEEERYSNAMFESTLLEAAKILGPFAINALTGLIPGGSGADNKNGALNMMGIISALMGALTPSSSNPQPGLDLLANLPVAPAPVPASNKAVSEPAKTVEAIVETAEKSNSQSFSFSKNISYKALKKGEHFSYAKDGGVVSVPVLGTISVATLIALIAAAGPIVTPIITEMVKKAPELLSHIINGLGKSPAIAKSMSGNNEFREKKNRSNTLGQKPATSQLSLQQALLETYGKKAIHISGRQFSYAKVAEVISLPLVIAIINALQQSPQFLNRVLGKPMQGYDQNYLTNLLAEQNRRALLEQMLRNGGSTAFPLGGVSLSFSTSEKIKLEIQKANALTVNGKPRYVYNVQSAIKLFLNVNTSLTPPARPIPKVIVQLFIKDLAGKETYLEKKFKLKEVYLNSLVELLLEKEELQSLPLQKDLMVCANFIYQSKEGSKSSGASEYHFIYLVNEYFLKGTGDKEGNEIALGDMNKYRVFWNKIWEGGTKTKKRWEVAFDIKYYLYYRFEMDANGRIETKIKTEGEPQDESSTRLEIEGKLKSGLEISPVELNKLLPAISSFPELTSSQLEAFRTATLQQEFNQEASARLELKGKDEERGALWAFPEVIIQKVILNKVQKTDDNGQVTTVGEEVVYFPRPSSIHFVGVKTK